jgi:CheY-like chemotaxis protein
MSHEIRTPMNAIMGISQMLNQYKTEGLDQTQKEGVEIIYRSGKRLLQLINNILDLSKIEAGKMEIKLAPFLVDEVIKDIQPLTEVLVEEKDVIITIGKQDSVPEEVISDQHKLHQVLMNLISNAVKFTDKGRIDVDLWYNDDQLHFEVKDTGIGISEEQLATIFDDFVQLDMKYQGTGLGLAISKRIVEMLGGEISVESEPGRGTTIKFYVKAKTAGPQKQDKNNESQAEVQNIQRPCEDNSKPCILIAEDDPDSRTTLRMMLGNDYNLVMAEDGAEALKKLRKGLFQIVLTDIEMPNVDGYELLEKIRQEDFDRGIVVIALTARVMEEDKEKIHEAGFDDFISKPVDMDLLKKTIQKYMALRDIPRPA